MHFAGASHSDQEYSAAREGSHEEPGVFAFVDMAENQEEPPKPSQ